MTGWRHLAGALLALFVLLPAANAHETRPIYLELKETAPGQYGVLWRTPVLAGMRLPVTLKLPDGVRNVREPVVHELTDSLLERRAIDAGPAGLAGRRIDFPGLQFTITDVLVRVERQDGTVTTELVRPTRPWFELAAPRGTLATAGVFLEQGIEHILLGVDHLLFVLGLLLLVPTTRLLVETITAFTVGHSITLSAAAIGIAHVPSRPIEVLIAASVLLLAVELARESVHDTLLRRLPWIAALAFGLLHGFGFAGALAEAGLPQRDVPMALLAFNVGIELGQLAFVAACLLAAAALRRVPVAWPRWVRQLPLYAMGSLAAFWCIERAVALLR